MSDSLDRVNATLTSMSEGAGGLYSTLNGETKHGKLAMLNAMTTSEPLADHLGENIDLVHFILQAAQVEDDNGEINDVIRSTLIAADGSAYHAVSSGLVNSLRNLAGIMGAPAEWDGPVTVQPIEVRTRKGYRTLTLRIMMDE